MFASEVQTNVYHLKRFCHVKKVRCCRVSRGQDLLSFIAYIAYRANSVIIIAFDDSGVVNDSFLMLAAVGGRR